MFTQYTSPSLVSILLVKRLLLWILAMVLKLLGVDYPGDPKEVILRVDDPKLTFTVKPHPCDVISPQTFYFPVCQCRLHHSQIGPEVGTGNKAVT